MWKEWLNPYNPYNSLKILVHKDYLEKVTQWFDNKDAVLPPPLMVTVDPTNLCNVNCFWCKNKDFRQREPRSINDQQLLELPAFLKEWGVRSVVLSGGEPLLHPKIGEFVTSLGEAGLSIGVKTNGLLLMKDAVFGPLLKYVQWIGISLDSATDQTFSKVKKGGIGTFEKIATNIKAFITERDSSRLPRVSLRFLIHHLNYGEMYAFANMAKSAGVDEVYFRPIFIPRYRYAKGVRKTAAYYLREARKDFESEEFHIYGLVSKFECEWDRLIRFKRCYAVALTGVFASDGKFYVCADRRGDVNLNLGRFYPFDQLKKKWGSEEHRRAFGKVSPQLCPKCGMALVNETVESCVFEDNLMSDFL